MIEQRQARIFQLPEHFDQDTQLRTSMPTKPTRSANFFTFFRRTSEFLPLKVGKPSTAPTERALPCNLNKAALLTLLQEMTEDGERNRAIRRVSSHVSANKGSSVRRCDAPEIADQLCFAAQTAPVHESVTSKN